jgi:hypothetical protein
MPKIDAKMKRIIAEIERRRADPAYRLFHSRPRIIHRRPSADTVRRVLEQAGVDFDEVKKANKALGLYKSKLHHRRSEVLMTRSPTHRR